MPVKRGRLPREPCTTATRPTASTIGRLCWRLIYAALHRKFVHWRPPEKYAIMCLHQRLGFTPSTTSASIFVCRGGVNSPAPRCDLLDSRLALDGSGKVLGNCASVERIAPRALSSWDREAARFFLGNVSNSALSRSSMASDGQKILPLSVMARSIRSHADGAHTRRSSSADAGQLPPLRGVCGR